MENKINFNAVDMANEENKDTMEKKFIGVIRLFKSRRIKKEFFKAKVLRFLHLGNEKPSKYFDEYFKNN